MMPAALAWLPVLLLSAFAGQGALAQANSPLELIKGGGTPASMNEEMIQNWSSANSCRLLVKPSEAATQPLRISPADVARKNRMGCLSPNDAIYGSNGCPTKLCKSSSGVVPLQPN
ncbi:MAG: hypothetical protein RLZZ32_1248 [Cyanobacteriota bacterium]|jgi:hypothetical protein